MQPLRHINAAHKCFSGSTKNPERHRFCPAAKGLEATSVSSEAGDARGARGSRGSSKASGTRDAGEASVSSETCVAYMLPDQRVLCIIHLSGVSAMLLKLVTACCNTRRPVEQCRCSCVAPVDPVKPVSPVKPVAPVKPVKPAQCRHSVNLLLRTLQTQKHLKNICITLVCKTSTGSVINLWIQ